MSCQSVRKEEQLFKAVKNGHFAEAELLLRIGANPNVLLQDGISAFHLAVGIDRAFTELFIRHGADVNVKSVDDWTPLHVCVSWNKIDSMRLLLDQGADPYIVNNDYLSPYELAIEYQNYECASVIKEYTEYLRELEMLQRNPNTYAPALTNHASPTTNDFNSVSLVRSSTINNAIDSNSASTKTTETVIERKPAAKVDAKTRKQSQASSSGKTKSSSKIEVVKISDLEKVISNMIEMKLQEKNFMNLSPTSTNTNSKTLSASPLLHIDTPKEFKASTASPDSNPLSSVKRNSSSRFHSPEASKRIPATMLLLNQTPASELTQVSPLQSPTNTLPSVLDFKNQDKYPMNTNSLQPIVRRNSSTSTVMTKIKNLLNKKTSPTASSGVFCSKNKSGLAGLCLGMEHVNSDFCINANQQPQNQTTDNELIVPVKSPKLSAAPPPRPPPPRKPSLFTEMGKELANIERNFNPANANLNNNSRQHHEPNLNEVIYHVDDDDIYFKETTLLTSDESTIVNYDEEQYYTADGSEILYSWDAYDTDKIEKLRDQVLNKTIVITRPDEVPKEIKSLTNFELRKRIEAFGDRPGPITPTTRKIYELRLMQLEKIGPAVDKIHNEFNEKTKGFSIELIDVLRSGFDNQFSDKIEVLMSDCFQTNTGNLREGHLKASFNYLLIDPRVSENLPARAKYLDSKEVFRIFIASIFYVGKGTRSRPYAHLYDALKMWKAETELNDQVDCKRKNKEQSRKIKQIINIWKDNCGVVSLHCFQNVIPCEAYTREASMIDCIGLNHLTNLKRGDYYGVASAWPADRKRKLGVILLKKACDIFVAEGERQIKPLDI